MSILENIFKQFMDGAKSELPELRKIPFYKGLNRAISIFQNPYDNRLVLDDFPDLPYISDILPFYQAPDSCIILKPSVDIISDAIKSHAPRNLNQIINNEFNFYMIFVDFSGIYKHKVISDLISGIEKETEIPKGFFYHPNTNGSLLISKHNPNKPVIQDHDYSENDTRIVTDRITKIVAACLIEYRDYLLTPSSGGRLRHKGQLTDRANKQKNKKKNEPIFRPIYINSNNQKANSKTNTSKISNRSKISHSFKVRGHFRNQPVGKGRADSKLIWINEHVRGAGEFITKTKNIIF
ncbi:hypothetical protein [Endozoicomonas ascidiicola]|uniref:hypothetical protein n=1 Tax=Endozoicomonas ascidiicola TaxID=1698521 RepID=UPI00083202DD|nr:hypothetical protein [Endozoicomonas ascidiicola]